LGNDALGLTAEAEPGAFSGFIAAGGPWHPVSIVVIRCNLPARANGRSPLPANPRASRRCVPFS